MSLGAIRPRMPFRRGLPLVVAVLTLVWLTGVTGRAEAGLGFQATLGGVVEGNGGIPQEGYTVSLYASGAQGTVGANLLGRDTTDADGRFQIDYTFPVPQPSSLNAVLYILAERGQAMLASAVGDVSPGDSVVVNERTTVAIGAAFAQFIDGRVISGNRYGVLNAVRMAANMADPETGLVGEVLDNEPNGGFTSTRDTFNSLANIVASCVADASNCQTLFDEATPPGGPAPTTVLQALANMTKYPSNNVDELFALGDGGPYAPALADAPTSWLLFIKFTGGFYSEYDSSNLMGGPGQVAIDERGFAWINDNYEPTEFLGIGCTGLRLLKFYPWGERFPGTPYFGGGLSGVGFGITLTPGGSVWVSSFGFEAPACADGMIPPDPAKKIPATHDSVSQFSPDGVPLSPFEGFTNGGIWWPQGTVSDRQGNIWVANCGNDTVTVIPGGNPALARNIPLPGGQGAAGNLRFMLPEEPLLKPFAIAIDPFGRAWVTGDKAQELYIVSPDGTVVTVESNGLLSWPMGISGDSKGNMWVSSSGSVDLVCGGTPLHPSSGEASVVLFPADGSPPTQYTGGGISIPWGNAVDGNDTLWVFNFGHQPLTGEGPFPLTGVSHFCGADASNCPAGLSTGDPISPPVTGYDSNALDRVTGGAIDPSGNLWLINNWKKAGPFLYNRNPGANSFVIVPGAAAPIRTPLIGPPVPFGAPGALDVPAPCDPLYEVCSPQQEEPDEPPPLAPDDDGEGSGPAAGRNRMPDLIAARLAARCEGDGSVEAVLTVAIFRPRAAKPFRVRFTVPGRSKHPIVVRVRPRGKGRVRVEAQFSTLDLRGPACGRRLVARIVPDNRLHEARIDNNTAVTRIRGSA